MLTTTKIDDRQLWRVADVVDGNDISWPIYCTPVADSGENVYWLVEPAIPVNSVSQQNFLYNRVKNYSVDSEGPRWLVRRTMLEKFAFKCAGITPKFYLKWPGEYNGGVSIEVEEKKPYEGEEPPTGDEFLKVMCGKINMPDLAIGKLFIHAFCDTARSWLLSGKGLDMGFASIHALPYRANWKGILHARWPNIASALKKPEAERDGILSVIGFYAALFSVDLVGMQSKQTFGWTLEIVEDKSMAAEFEKIEQEMYREHAATNHSYIWRLANIVRSKSSEIFHIFNHWVEKAGVPLGAVDDSLPTDSWVLHQRTSHRLVRPVAAPVPDTYFTTAAHNPNNSPVTPPIIDAKTLASVQEVPDADFEISMRPHRRDGKN